MTGKNLPKAKYALLCDDIREEKSNKMILVGLYSSKIIFHNPLPALLSKLCLRICFDVSKPYLETFNLLIKKPNKSVMGPFPVNIPPDSEGMGESYLNVTFSPFSVEAEGSHDIYTEHGGKEEWITRFFVELATLSPQEKTHKH